MKKIFLILSIVALSFIFLSVPAMARFENMDVCDEPNIDELQTDYAIKYCKENGDCLICTQTESGIREAWYSNYFEYQNPLIDDHLYTKSTELQASCNGDNVVIPRCAGEDIVVVCEFGCYDGRCLNENIDGTLPLPELTPLEKPEPTSRCVPETDGELYSNCWETYPGGQCNEGLVCDIQSGPGENYGRCVPGEEEVPEFGIIAGIAILVAGLVFVYRRSKN